MGYTKRNWACPFYTSDAFCVIRCEMGRIKFFDFRAEVDYADRYCGNACGWRECTLARSYCDYYERITNDGEKRR